MREKMDYQKKQKVAYFKDNIVDEIINLKYNSSTFRIYENDVLKISYIVNSEDDEYGYYVAEKNNANPYKHTTTLNIQKNVIFDYDNITDRNLVFLLENIGNELLKISKNISIKYTFSNARYTLTNINKLHMNSESGIHVFELFHGDSKFVFEYKKIDESNIIQDMKRLLSLDIKKTSKYEPKKIILNTNMSKLYDFFESILSTDNVIKNKLVDKKLFSDKLTLYTSLDENDAKSRKYGLLPFFDWEGNHTPYYKTSLIEKGVVIKPYTNRDFSEKYEIENTACAYSANADYPECKLLGAYIEPGDKNLEKLVDKGIYIDDADVDFKNDEITMRIKQAFLYDNGELVDKVENFEFTVNLYRLFGEKFLGVSKDFLFGSDANRAMAFEL